MGFLGGALAAVALAAVCALLLYAYGLARSVDEPFFRVLIDLTKSVMTKGFWK